MATHWNWLVPFEGRNHSGVERQNFLCSSDNVYVMDNHRAALWCWLQSQDLEAPHSLIHIDRHTDALGSQMKTWLANLPSWDVGIDDYLSARYAGNGGTAPVFRWDNYLSIYLEVFGDNLKKLRFITHNEGDKPKYKGTLVSDLWDVPENLEYWLDKSGGPWIVNIDLDYFFCSGPDDNIIPMFSEVYFDTTFIALKRAMDKGAVAAVTLCLTPDSFTPGWAATEALASRGLGHLGLTWALP